MLCARDKMPGVQRSDSLKSAPAGGARTSTPTDDWKRNVSFNRDVRVKRIGESCRKHRKTFYIATLLKALRGEVKYFTARKSQTNYIRETMNLPFISILWLINYSINKSNNNGCQSWNLCVVSCDFSYRWQVCSILIETQLSILWFWHQSDSTANLEKSIHCFVWFLAPSAILFFLYRNTSMDIKGTH